MIAAATEPVIVHDKSERDRETRAMWQGLSWVRYALIRNWYNIRASEVSRTGMHVSTYWEEQYQKLSGPTLAILKYYKKYLAVDFPQFSVESCWGNYG